MFVLLRMKSRFFLKFTRTTQKIAAKQTGEMQRDYLKAIHLLQNGSINVDQLITHRFPLSHFADAFATQTDPNARTLKIIIEP
jgi:threonine dehydrogenase-like Zn-dependent dehydrogenase